MASETLPQLRPLRVSELLDQAIRLYRQNFVKFVAILGTLQIPVILLQAIFTTLYAVSNAQMQQRLDDPIAMRQMTSPFEIFTPSYFIGVGGNCLLTIVALILIQGIATAAVTRSAAVGYLGKSSSFTDAYRKILPSFWKLVGAVFLVVALMLLVSIWSAIPCIGWVTGVGMLVFLSGIIMPLAMLILVTEKQSVTGSLRRAWDLTRRRFWPVIGFMGTLSLLSWAIAGGPSLIITFLFLFLQDSLASAIGLASTTALQSISQALLGLITGLIYSPLQLICMALMYLDLRVRTEDFDLALQASSALESEEFDVEQSLTQAPPPEVGGLITWPEIGHFALFSLALIVLLVALYAIIMGVMFSAVGLGGPPGY